MIVETASINGVHVYTFSLIGYSFRWVISNEKNDEYNSNKENLSTTLYVNFEVAKIYISWVIGSSIDHSVASFRELVWWNHIR